MMIYPPMHGIGAERPRPARERSIEEQIAWDRAVQDFKDAKKSKNPKKAAAAAMTMSEGIKRPIDGNASTEELAHAAAELEITGKAGPIPIKIAVFNGEYGRDWKPGSTNLIYRTSPETAARMSKQFMGVRDRKACAVSVGTEQIRNGTVPKCVNKGPKQKDAPMLLPRPRYETPVSVVQDGMLAAQDPDRVTFHGPADMYGGSGPIRLGVPCRAQPFLSADVAARDASKALQVDTIIRNANTSVADYLGSGGFSFESRKQPDITAEHIARTRDKARGGVYRILNELDAYHEKFEALGIRTVASYAGGHECKAVYLDLTHGKPEEAMAELARLCGSGEDLGHVKDFGMRPTGIYPGFAVNGRDRDGNLHTVAPVMFASNADIEAFPMQINYAQLAVEDQGEPGLRWADLGYSGPVISMSHKAGDGLIKPGDIDRLRKAVDDDRACAVGEVFGLKDVQLGQGELAARSLLSRETRPTDRMIGMKAGSIYGQLMNVRSALQAGGVDVKAGMSWTEIPVDDLNHQGMSMRL